MNCNKIWWQAGVAALVFAGARLVAEAASNDHVIIVSTVLESGWPIIRDVAVTPGQLPNHYAAGPTNALDLDLDFRAELLDAAGEVCYSRDFYYHYTVQVPPPDARDKTTPGSARPDTIKLDLPQTAIFLPAVEAARSVRLVNRRQPLLADQCRLPEPRAGSTSAKMVPSQPGHFNLLIVASGYEAAQMDTFRARAEAMKNLILATSPFNAAQSKVNVHVYENTAALGCWCGCYGTARLMCCELGSVLAAAAGSGYAYDEILVVHNTATYCGGGYRDYGDYQADSVSSYAMAYGGTYYGPEMALHEFGHSYGDLCDEYYYYSSYPYRDCVNCRPSCSLWSDISPTCQTTCEGWSTYRRPDDSIMLDFYTLAFNSASVALSLQPRLEYFIGKAEAPDDFWILMQPALQAKKP